MATGGVEGQGKSTPSRAMCGHMATLL